MAGARWAAAWLASALAVAAAAQEVPASVAANPEPATAFINVTLVPMDRDGALPGQTVVVSGGRIEAVGASGQIAVPEGALVVDGEGKFLCPGLVDSHIHLDPFVGSRPDFGDAPLFLAYGVTTVMNLRGDSDTIAWKKRIQEGSLLAPNLYTAGEFVNEPRVNTPDEAQREVEAQALAGYDMIKFREVIDFERGGVLTTKGLAEPAYFRLCEAARQAGLPLVGHAPYRVGLEGLLAARQSLAHTNELANLYFLPPLNLGRGFPILLVRYAFLALFAIVALWGGAALAFRPRFPGPRVTGPASMVRRIGAWSLLLSLGCAAVWALAVPPGRYYGNWALLAVLTLLTLVLLFLPLRMMQLMARAWGGSATSSLAAIAATGACLAAAALAGGMGYWTLFAWRGCGASVTSVAKRCKAAGIWVQSTLVLYETGMGVRDGYRLDQLKKDPALRYIPAEMREAWRKIPAFAPGWMRRLWSRHPEFTRDLLGALHREGVPIMAGTDALGVPLVIPGASLHRELALLRECGLTPQEVLRSATSAPALFLGEDAEFGTVTPGKRADLLLLEANPLEDLKALERPAGVVVRGRYLARSELDKGLEFLASEPPPKASETREEERAVEQ